MKEVRIWVNGTDLLFQSKKATRNYDDEINLIILKNGFMTSYYVRYHNYNCLIVVDNVSYHSRRIEKVYTNK